jgi:hypothetical protein
MEVIKTVEANEFYSLCVVRLPDSPAPVYSVVHTEHSVPEISTSILANARKMLKMLTEWERNPDSAEAQNELPHITPEMLS